MTRSLNILRALNRPSYVLVLGVLVLSSCRKPQDVPITTKETKTQVIDRLSAVASNVKERGKDGAGRYWYSTPDKSSEWMYDPKTEVLHVAKKDKGAPGGYIFIAMPEVSPASLGLASNVEYKGRDKRGRDWYSTPTKSEEWMYNPKEKKLFNVKDGKTTEVALPSK